MSRTIVVFALAVVAVLANATCEKVPMTAPAGTSMFLQANPDFVVANGGHSVVTAVLTEPAGTLVPDGTVVMFFTDLGTIDPSVKTVDGIARANFVADSRSGTANVTAMSGSGAIAPATTPAALSGAGPSPTGPVAADLTARAQPSGGVSAQAAGGRLLAVTATGTGSATLKITIGSALPARVLLTANPPRIAGSRTSEIIATVYDANGNPVQNVPVIFSTTGSTETLDSGGSPRFTDSNGQAFDILRSRAIAGGAATTAQVTATVPNGINGTVNVTVAIP